MEIKTPLQELQWRGEHNGGGEDIREDKVEGEGGGRATLGVIHHEVIQLLSLPMGSNFLSPIITRDEFKLMLFLSSLSASLFSLSLSLFFTKSAGYIYFPLFIIPIYHFLFLIFIGSSNGEEKRWGGRES